MLVLDSKINSNKKLTRFVRCAEKELDKFFGVKLDPAMIILLNSRRDIDAIFGKKTPAWLVGFTRGNIIYILSPEVYTRESSHKNPKDFWKTLKHEYCHLYYKKITGDTYPIWLNEGLACYLAKQNRLKPDLRDALSILNDRKQGRHDIYKVGYFWVSILVEEFGKRKLLDLIGSFKPQMTNSEFKRIFYLVYKMKFIKNTLEKLYSKY